MAASELAAALVAIRAAAQRKDWPNVERLSAATIAAHGADAEVLLLSGVAAIEMHRLAPAIARLKAALAQQPTQAQAWAQLSRALSLAHETPASLAAAARAQGLGALDALTLDTLGVVWSRGGAHDKAAACFADAVGQQPGNAAFHFNLASSLKFLGDFEAAEAAYGRCLALDPQCWRAYPARSQLRRQQPQRNHLAQLTQRLASSASDTEGTFYLHMALSKEYEDLSRDAEAFRHLRLGKALRAASLGYSPARDAELFAALHTAFPGPLPPAPVPASAARTPRPVFVVGMPRTGTTLVERIISNHPRALSVGESQNFGVALRRAASASGPSLLDADTVAAAARLAGPEIGETYRRETAPAAATELFIDKLPQNFLYAGFIARALPEARIVCLRRHPLDTCLSNFRQLFAQGAAHYHYSYDLLDTARYYVLFDRLIAHWRRILPTSIFMEVQYESLIDSQEAETRRLLEFCGLDWDPACLAFERNQAPVSTASAVQVRSPIYRTSMGRWHRYEAELAGVRALLVQEGVAV